jgi:hypothetical protein
MLVSRKTVAAGTVASDSDKVVAWAPIAPGGKLLSVTGELHMIGPEGTLIGIGSPYGFSGRVEPVVDPDGVLSMDTLWDHMVTKPGPISVDTTDRIDFDWDSQDTAPDVEIGEIDVTDITGMLDQGSDIFPGRIEMVSFAKTPRGWIAGTPDTYVPTDYKTFRSSKVIAKPSENMPAYAMLAVSSPALGDEETSHTMLGGANSARDWGILQNLRSIMEDFWRINAGMIESSAESPYDHASVAVENLVVPPIVQPSTAIIEAETWTWICQADWLLDFPDSMVPGILKG